MNLQELQNGLNAEIQGIKHGGFPLEVFPQKVQSLILTLLTQEGFRVEYSASAMLVAAAVAIGNARRLRVRGTWSVAPMFYMIFVGRPGIGKTPPLEFAFKPIIEEDRRRQEVYDKEREAWEWFKKENTSSKDGESQIEMPAEPVLQKITLTDFTYEAMMYTHDRNQRGIVVKYDEIIGMFKTLDRYNSSSTIQAFLSFFSNTAFSMTRCNSLDKSVDIANPCLSIIGTTQTKLMAQIASREFQDNGLLDRFLLVYPQNAKMTLWEKSDGKREHIDIAGIWNGIIKNLLDLDYNEVAPTLLYMCDEAENAFVEWHNDYATHINNIEDDNEINTRMLKWDSIVARLALVLQLLHWASGEMRGDTVELSSIKGALKLSAYFEGCYARLKKYFGGAKLSPNRKRLLSLLPERFSTKQAIEAGNTFNFGADGVKHALGDMVDSGILTQPGRGEYIKVPTQTT